MDVAVAIVPYVLEAAFPEAVRRFTTSVLAARLTGRSR